MRIKPASRPPPAPAGSSAHTFKRTATPRPVPPKPPTISIHDVETAVDASSPRLHLSAADAAFLVRSGGYDPGNPRPASSDDVLEPSEVGMVLDDIEDEILDASAVGLVLEPEAASPERPAEQPAERPADDPGCCAEESRKTWFPRPRPAAANLVETIETSTSVDPQRPVRRITPRKKNPYRAPESTWSTPVVDDVDDFVPPRRRALMWTSVSAGLTAALCCLGFLATSPEDGAPQVEQVEATIISYDEDLLREPEPKRAADTDEEMRAQERRSHALSLALRGRSNFNAGRTDLALSQFHDALEYNLSNRVALTYLGKYHLDRGHAGKAADYLRRAVRVEPRDAKAHFMLGQAYESLGRPGKAQYHYRAAHKHGHPEAATNFD